jgi:hypothetical protein
MAISPSAVSRHYHASRYAAAHVDFSYVIECDNTDDCCVDSTTISYEMPHTIAQAGKE